MLNIERSVKEYIEKATKLLNKCDALEKETMQLEAMAAEIEAEQYSGIPRIDLLNHAMIQGMIEQSRQRWKRISLILGTVLILTWIGIILSICH